MTELLEIFNIHWLRELGLGGMIGAAQLLVPAFVLWASGIVRWQWNAAGFSTLAFGLLLYIEVTVADELLFRGSVFQ